MKEINTKKFIVIGRWDNNIVVQKDYSDFEERGEIAHVLVELEIIKQELLEMWNDNKQVEEE